MGTTGPGEGSPPIVRALWAVPRSVSTAFERMVIERDDHVVFDEPFSAAYYDGPARVSPRFPESDPTATVDAIASTVDAAATRGPVFVKDMAYHPGPALLPLATRWTSTFLVRDPRWSIPSMARIWPDVTEDEAGFTAIHRAVSALRATGAEPVVIDSDELCRDPEAVIGAWCDAMGLEPRPDTLTWTAGMRPEWERWRDWYGSTARSTGFVPPRDGAPPTPQSTAIAELVERSVPLYEALRSGSAS